VGAVALVPRDGAVDDRRRRVQRGQDRRDRHQAAQLGRGVGLVGPVEVGLHRRGAQHHVEPAAADGRHVRAHHVVAQLGHPRHVGAAAERAEADRQPGQAQRAADLGQGRAVLGERRDQLVAVDPRLGRQLELPAGLDRDLIGAAGQRDDVAALLDRLPAARREAGQHGADPVGAIVRRRGADRRAVGAHADQLVLGADPPVGARLLGLAEVGDELVDGGQRNGVGFVDEMHGGVTLPRARGPSTAPPRPARPEFALASARVRS
jgi:hypothetical protein